MESMEESIILDARLFSRVYREVKRRVWIACRAKLENKYIGRMVGGSLDAMVVRRN